MASAIEIRKYDAIVVGGGGAGFVKMGVTVSVLV